jgi:hypothetical protein
MPFSTLNNAWSNLAPYYNTVNNDGAFANPNNVTYTQKPQQPQTKFSSFDDGLIRGGVLNAGLASTRDTARIGNFLKSPKGLLWITKQVGLQLSNPLLETKAKVNIANANNIPNLTSDQNSVTYAGNGLIPTRIYNSGINTLAQIPLNAIGAHIVRHGLLPLPAGAGYNYEKITRENNLLSNQSTTNTSAQNYEYGPKFGLIKPPSPGASPIPPPPPPPGQSVKVGDTTTIYNNKNDKFYAGRKGKDEIVMFASPEDAASGKISPFALAFFSNTTDPLSDALVSAKSFSKPSKSVYNLLPNRLIQNLNKIILGDITYRNGSNSVVLSHKFGGPQSVYGIGFTTIRTSPDQRTNTTENKADPKRNLLNGFIPIGYNSLSVLSFNSTQNSKELSYINIGKSISSTNGDVNNVEITYGVSHAGNKNNLSTTRKVDSINVIEVVNNKVFYTDNVNKLNSEVLGETVKDKVAGTYGKDIIKFRIEFLNNTSADSQNVLAFRAYIDDFSDGITANWNPYRYVGRGEEFYIYEGFSRSISVTFSIYAHTSEEMKPLYKKLNYLMSSFAPDYSDPGGKMRGNVGYLTIGDYIIRQPGVFNDIKVSNTLDTHWEINDYELPKYLKVALSFKPIHNFLPRLASTTGKNAPFVGEKILS